MRAPHKHRFRNAVISLQRLCAAFSSFSPRNKLKLYPLIPDSAIKSNQYYVDCLKSFIRIRAVKNIALSGDYGVGKSSVIGSFCKSFFSKARKTRVISLLTLSEEPIKNSKDGDMENGISSKDNVRKNIQREIFRQLYYGERPGSLSLSRYSRIGKFPILVYSILVVVTSVLLNATLAQFGLDISYITPNIFFIGFLLCLILALNSQTVTLKSFSMNPARLTYNPQHS